MWLNEGFATFFQYYAVEALHPKSFVWQWWYLYTRDESAMHQDKDLPLNRFSWFNSWKKWQPSSIEPHIVNIQSEAKIWRDSKVQHFKLPDVWGNFEKYFGDFGSVGCRIFRSVKVNKRFRIEKRDCKKSNV